MKKFSIKWKASLAVSVYILTLLLGAILLTTVIFEQKLIQEKNNSIIDAIKSIVESYKESFVINKLDKIDEMIQKLKKFPEIKDILVLSKDGKVIGSDKWDYIGNNKKDILKIFSNTDKILVINNTYPKTKLFYKVQINGDTLGYVAVNYDQSLIKQNVDEEIMSFIIQSFTITLFVIIASFIGTFLITGIIIKPLINLKEKIFNITTKDFKHAKILDEPLKKVKDKECPKNIIESCWIVSDDPQEYLDKLGETAIKECVKCEKYQQLTKDEIEELYFSFCIMIASLKDYLNKLEEAYKEREALNCMATMGEMSAKIAHEIKNALYAIGNAATYMKQNINNEIVKEFSSVIKDEVNRLNEMTVSFLNFSKLLEPKFQLNDLNEEVKHTVKLLNDDFDYENVKLIANLGDIPKFEFDKNMIKQVLFNLLLNALDAVKEKNRKERFVKISTYLKKEKNNKYVVLEIKDNGVGIKKEHLDKVFKPFFTTKQKGTGLGLPMVYKIIRSHNGNIYVESEYGKWTKFIVLFQV
ncbi:MAG TPA: GHKL domain-containing protein [Persephonella sp.]|nr:GHKL domain-containing protein [Hydrogenothermaceae bacterium]HIQ24962.1 GHKL domain-containing protein [Persephonella sp.]